MSCTRFSDGLIFAVLFFSFSFFFLLTLDQSCFSPVNGAFPHPQKPAVLPNTFKRVFQLNIKWIIKRKWKKCTYFLVSSIFFFWLASHLNTSFFVLCTFLRYITSIGPVILESATPNHLISTSLPGGTDSNDFNVTIRVDIYGKDGASDKDKFIVKVFWLMLSIWKRTRSAILLLAFLYSSWLRNYI